MIGIIINRQPSESTPTLGEIGSPRIKGMSGYCLAELVLNHFRSTFLCALFHWHEPKSKFNGKNSNPKACFTVRRYQYNVHTITRCCVCVCIYFYIAAIKQVPPFAGVRLCSSAATNIQCLLHKHTVCYDRLMAQGSR